MTTLILKAVAIILILVSARLAIRDLRSGADRAAAINIATVAITTAWLATL